MPVCDSMFIRPTPIENLWRSTAISTAQNTALFLRHHQSNYISTIPPPRTSTRIPNPDPGPPLATSAAIAFPPPTCTTKPTRMSAIPTTRPRTQPRACTNTNLPRPLPHLPRSRHNPRTIRPRPHLHLLLPTNTTPRVRTPPHPHPIPPRGHHN